jgi:hypothetical protein
MHAREQQLAEEHEAVEDAQRERERQLRERVDDEARRGREMAKQAQATMPITMWPSTGTKVTTYSRRH